MGSGRLRVQTRRSRRALAALRGVRRCVAALSTCPGEARIFQNTAAEGEAPTGLDHRDPSLGRPQAELARWNDLDLRAVDTVRLLAADAVQRAGNGHPGTAMSLAPHGKACTTPGTAPGPAVFPPPSPARVAPPTGPPRRPDSCEPNWKAYA